MKNTVYHYGWLAILLHWSSAVLLIALFSLGYWMVDLGYYHVWYKDAPDLHRSFGTVLFCLMTFRIIWKWCQVQPKTLDSYTKVERVIGKIVHSLLYLLSFIIMCSGYLISTADGHSINVFQLIHIPSMGQLFENQEDITGDIHKYAAYIIMGMVVSHILAALKHHFIDKDITLRRMITLKRDINH